MQHKILAPLVMLFMSGGITSASLAAEFLDISQDIESGASIDLVIPFGEVVITGWAEDRIQITGELGEKVEGYRFTERSGRTYFEVELPSQRGCRWWFSCNNYRSSSDYEANLEIFVPSQAKLDLEGVNVSVAVSQLSSSSHITTVNGRIQANDLSGVVVLSTVNGTIEASQLSGRINFHAVNGDIIDNDSSGNSVEFDIVNGSIDSNSSAKDVRITGVNGSIDLELGAVDDLHISNVNGRVNVDVDLNSSGFINVSSVNGTINLNLPTTVSASFDITSQRSGNIVNRLSNDEPDNDRERYSRFSNLRFDLNDASARVNISTLNGRVTLNSYNK